MINILEVNETNKMITQENLDVRTITLGISLLDCADDRLEELNRTMGATILMVTHDAFTASCCRRVVFLQDGQIFLELRREGQDRRAFFQRIIRVVSQLGGEMEDVL